MKSQILYKTVIATSLILCAGTVFSAATDKYLQISSKSGLSLRDKCQKLMHDDAAEYKICADEFLKKIPLKSNDDKAKYLGASYYAWLASMAGRKNGMPNSDSVAVFYLKKFRPFQLELKISDDDLCKTIEGDCVTRNAQMIEMENKTKSPS
jgi:hypothetical protein